MTTPPQHAHRAVTSCIECGKLLVPVIAYVPDRRAVRRLMTQREPLVVDDDGVDGLLEDELPM